MSAVAVNSAAYGSFTVGTHSFILDVTNRAGNDLAFADGVNEITITVTETNADNAEAWSVTFASETKYYVITISGLTSGDAVWPNLYIKDATNITKGTESQLSWNGFGFGGTSVTGFEGAYYLVGGLH